MIQNDDYTEGYEEELPIEPNTEEDIEYERRQRLCAVCHTYEKDYSDSSRAVLCYECRQNFLMLRIPIGIKLFIAAVCAVFVLSVCMLPSILSTYKVYIKANEQMKAREFAVAYYNYSLVLEKYNDSVPVILKTAEAAMAAQYFDELAQTLDFYLVGKSLNDNEYSKAMDYSRFLDDYYGTSEEIQRIIEEIADSFTEEDSVKFVKQLHKEFEALLSQKEIDKTLVYFYMGYTSDNIEDAEKYYRLAAEQDSRFTYPYSYYGNVLRRTGKVSEAEQAYQHALKQNACDAFSLRGLGVLRLLEGEKESALTMVRRAYEIEPYGLYIAETLIITLCENDFRDEAMELLERLTGEGMQIEEDLQGYLDGNINVQQYYIG